MVDIEDNGERGRRRLSSSHDTDVDDVWFKVRSRSTCGHAANHYHSVAVVHHEVLMFLTFGFKCSSSLENTACELSRCSVVAIRSFLKSSVWINGTVHKTLYNTRQRVKKATCDRPSV
jgi:hypothetical protein